MHQTVHAQNVSIAGALTHILLGTWCFNSNAHSCTDGKMTLPVKARAAHFGCVELSSCMVKHICFSLMIMFLKYEQATYW